MKTWATLLLALAAVIAMPMAHAEGTVARGVVTTSVVDREPANDLDKVPASDTKVLFFTELRGMAGQTIKHRWMHNGETMAEVSFNVGGPRWRVWSSKSMIPDWQGEWTVQVVDGSDQVLTEKSFSYGEAAAEAPAAEKAPMEEPAPMEEKSPMEDKASGETMNGTESQDKTEAMPASE